MKKTSLWNEVLNADNYGKLWQSMNLSKEKLEGLIALHFFILLLTFCPIKS